MKKIGQYLDTIFFHMGPGANAQTDALILSDVLPQVHFWDQPQQKNAALAFKNLVDAAETEVRGLIKANGGTPIKAIAHSFGGHLFHQLTMRDPKLFSSCTFYGTGYDVPAGFFKLLKLMSQNQSTEEELRQRMISFLESHQSPKAADIWSYIGLITGDPAFFRHYWPSGDLFNAFAPLALKAAPLDMESFQNILNDFLSHHFHPDKLSASPWRGPIEIQLGTRDPLVNVDRESALWKTIFPQAHIKVLENSGHFVHLEKYLKA